MNITPQTEAVLLLTVSLGKAASKDVKPLSAGEWARFAFWLKEKGLKPDSLLNADLEDLLSGWVDKKINRLRLNALLQRGAALGLALEKWSRAGLWVLTRSDPEYPKRLREKLGKSSPPILFGCGNKKLLNRGGIAVVGSRNVSDDDAKFTETLGYNVADQGYSIVSGGARGVDQIAMLAALEASGTVIGILADSLLRMASSAKYRQAIMRGDLVLISPFNPEAGFNVGNAMGRNRYIYCLSNAAVVVCSTPNKGGTWTGAVENLNGKWVPLWVKDNRLTSSGNADLNKLGAGWFPKDIRDYDVLKHINAKPVELSESPTLIPKDGPRHHKALLPEKSDTVVSFYDVFLLHIVELTRDNALNISDIAHELEISKSQVTIWVNRAMEENKLEKLHKPVRYKFKTADIQKELFA